jgi:chromate transporter
MIYLELLLSFMQIGLFSIGGGYAAMPLIQNQVVDLHPWLTIQQFADVMTIAEMTPGPIALNAATFVGIQVAGIPGALVATFGCVLPPFCIVLGLAWIYFKFRELGLVKGILAGIRPAVVAMIASAGVSLMILSFYGQQHLPADLLNVNWLSVVLFGAGLFILRKWKLSPIAVMLGCGVIGTVLQLIFK